MPGPVLYIMARQPVAGQTKTRLQPLLGEKGAALLTAWMIRETVQTAKQAWPGPVVLLAWPDTRHPLFAALARVHEVGLEAQAAGDLGWKMSAALARGIEQHGAAAVMGVDVPQCSAMLLQQAGEALTAGQAVIGPSHDGGYYLLGLTGPAPSLFEDMPWSTSSVYAETLHRVRALQMDVLELETLQDIDTPEDLHRVAQAHASLQKVLQQLTTGSMQAD